MKQRFFFTRAVTKAYGYQYFYVDAETQNEAEAIVNSGGGVFESEEIEVQDLGRPELSAVEHITAASKENGHE